MLVVVKLQRVLGRALHGHAASLTRASLRMHSTPSHASLVSLAPLCALPHVRHTLSKAIGLAPRAHCERGALVDLLTTMCISRNCHFQSGLRKYEAVSQVRSDKIAPAPFDYGLLWMYLKEDIVPLLGAVLTAFGAAWLNLQIPLHLGQVWPAWIVRSVRFKPLNPLRHSWQT
jgi:hypothetical protein